MNQPHIEIISDGLKCEVKMDGKPLPVVNVAFRQDMGDMGIVTIEMYAKTDIKIEKTVI